MKSQRTRLEGESGSTLGLIFWFSAGLLLIATGLIVFVYALFDQTRTTDIILNIRPSTWRVLMLVGGVGLVVAGGNLFVGKYWARVVGLTMAAAATLGAALNLGTDPLFAVSLILLNLGIIFALTVHWSDIKEVTEGWS